ncbi:hypothetical protein JKA74_14090 [Marivirga sp. S37H4]|uniref:Uncharacterized protein n=1 Tax=Marivirga aurantiaca TaxID=2802615 RepID=A0A935C9H2_9BACT|nr:hypothetical protein [Marivirga aurantiaca]MBK6266171.1 hypothetical protein [Marivirga aurantiaca]
MNFLFPYGQRRIKTLLLFLIGMVLVGNIYATTDTSEYEKKRNLIVSQQLLEQHAQWNKLIEKLEKKSSANPEYFLDFLFYKTHNTLLKNYGKHSDFGKMLETGDYDCVSGSLAYSLILTYFNIDHSIIETDYHVFIVARIDGKDFILESTDPLNGFIKDENAVIQYIAKFKPDPLTKVIQNTIEIGAESYLTTETNTIFKKINIKQLSGLQYYNHGIYAIKEQNYPLAKAKISQALALYPSERIYSVYELISSLENADQ